MNKNCCIKLVYITTIPLGLVVLVDGQASYMKAQGFEVHGLSSPGEALDKFAKHEGIQSHPVEMTRRITPLRDLVALFKVWRELRRIRPQIVDALTPKGGLLGMIAAWLAGVPVRVYRLMGLRYMTATGVSRLILRWAERMACYLAHRVICVSHSLREVTISKRLCPAAKIRVLLSGSGNGVDAGSRFNPTRVGEHTRLETRSKYGIPNEALVVGFVGRIVRDKGLVELTNAWRILCDEFPQLHLLIVGPFETQDPVPSDVEETFRNDSRIHLTGLVGDMPPLYAAMDILVLPSYREGFPYSLLEGAAMALPVVSTRIPGCVDAVLDGVTGMLVPPRDAEALADAIRLYINDPVLRRKHGQAGRERVLREFQQEPIWEALHQEYMRLLQEKKVLSRGEASGVGLTHVIKRLIDIVGTLMGLLAFGLLMLIIAVAVLLTMGPPVLFRQQRAGLHGRPFTLLKFRTMTDACDERGNLLPDAQRLTRLGRFLRSTSLDELPTLVNVLRGEMSLVGPRPLVMAYLDRYTPEQARRHEVKPGITGWAQVNGRNALTWEEKFALDVWYVDHWSLWLDLKIIALTVWKVLKREGINQPGQATMEEFMGSSGR